jgi:uncharacterized protein (TIGR02391 family)
VVVGLHRRPRGAAEGDCGVICRGMRIESFSESLLRQISHALESAATHRQLTDLFNECQISGQGGNPKWERILLALSARQKQDGCGNNIVAFIQASMNPVRFVGQQDTQLDVRHRLNEVLAFAGFQVGDDGKLRQVAIARTVDEATERAGHLRRALSQRSVHPDVLRFCRAELVQQNFFHAVFEATKSVADKVREKTGLESDGAELVDQAFSVRNPLLAINSLRSETEQSEQKGFANLLKGVFGTFRNVTAHAPKIRWPIEEQDALDLLTMVSYLHRRLDRAVKVPRASSGSGG